METKVTDGVTMVRFDMPAVAQQMRVETDTLAQAMLEATARALLRDAWQLLDLTMQERGLTVGIDPFPDGWPTKFLATVAIERLFPEPKEPQEPGQPDPTHAPGHA